MLISCSSCNSKYLVNSADLKPDGRNVQCARCGHNWFQTSIIQEAGILSNSAPSTEENDKNDNEHNGQIANLPSKYVEVQKPSILNSILIIIFLFILITGFWFFTKNGINFFVLINFYFQEFYFNLKLLMNDLASIVHQILN